MLVKINTTYGKKKKKKKKKNSFKKQVQKGISSNLKKVIYKNPVANIRHNDERLNIFPLRLEQSKHLALLFNIILEVLVNATKEGKGRREEREWRGEEGRRGKGHRSFSNLMLHVSVCVWTPSYTYHLVPTESAEL